MIGGGVTGCSCALTLAERGVRVRVYEQRRVAGGASGRNGGFGSRGAAMPYDVARRELGAARRAPRHEPHRAVARSDGGAGGRRVPARRQPAPGRPTLTRPTPCAPSTTRCVPTASRSNGSPTCRRRSIGCTRRPSSIRRTARFLLRAGCGGSPGGRSRRARRSSRARRVTVDEVDADAVVVCADGFTASLLPELAGAVVATRGQMLATAPLAELRYPQPHSARARLRLLAAAPRRAAR